MPLGPTRGTTKTLWRLFKLANVPSPGISISHCSSSRAEDQDRFTRAHDGTLQANGHVKFRGLEEGLPELSAPPGVCVLVCGHSQFPGLAVQKGNEARVANSLRCELGNLLGNTLEVVASFYKLPRQVVERFVPPGIPLAGGFHLLAAINIPDEGNRAQDLAVFFQRL
jgi:hypothetical protein